MAHRSLDRVALDRCCPLGRGDVGHGLAFTGEMRLCSAGALHVGECECERTRQTEKQSKDATEPHDFLTPRDARERTREIRLCRSDARARRFMRKFLCALSRAGESTNSGGYSPCSSFQRWWAS